MANTVGRDLINTTPFLSKGWRRIRQNMVLSQDPFGLWRVWKDEPYGEIGDRVLELAESVKSSSPEIRYPAEFYSFVVRWLRNCQHAYRHYVNDEFEQAAFVLQEASREFDKLIDWMGYFSSLGGSGGDVHRAIRLKVRVIDVANAVLSLQGYKPSFEVITHPAYVPGDQAAWRTGQY
jgi:hypothetical protein